MSRQNKADETNFFRPTDAIWLTDVVARELKEKQASAAAPKIREKPQTTLAAQQQKPARAPLDRAAGGYAATRIVPARPAEAEEAVAEPAPRRKRLIPLLRRRAAREAAPAPKPARPRAKQDRSDFVVGAMGIVLGLTCALFPWYIFFNQEKFGVREFVFSGERGNGTPQSLAYQPSKYGQPFGEGEVPKLALDFFPTATTMSAPPGGRTAVPASEQPFPADLINYRLVHVANGRAMIMDDAGLWVVQPGSQLPDASRVASIERRDGRWVLITSQDRKIVLEP